mgnify:CR=1 FL=1
MEAQPRQARLRRAARARAFAFLATLAVGAAAILGLPLLLEARDPYGEAVDGTAARWAAGLAVRDQVALKAAHALAEAPYDVGLFGNSRLVAVGAQHVAPFQGRLFNFAVGGTSFLQSVRMFRYLAERGHAPKIAIVSLDNFAIGYFGYRYWPDPIFDTPAVVLDAASAARIGGGAFDAGLKGAWVAVAEVRAAWREFRRAWSADMIELRLLALTGSDATGPVYRSDGSVAEVDAVLPAQAGDVTAPAPEWPQHQRDLLIVALQQLAAAAEAAGAAVIVYESPVQSSYRSALSPSQATEVEAVRSAFFAACAGLPVTCLPAPELAEDPSAPRWSDCCHAPPALLGRFIGDLLRQARG